MHSAKRSVIEQEIKYRMSEILYNKGFNIEAVLLKSIKLPERISASIERKLEAEQEALRMAFVAEQQRKEVERQLILEEGNKKTAIIRAEGKKEATILEAQAEAEAIEIKAEAVKRSNNLINSTITPNLLKQQQIEAFKELSKSPNSKLMILDAETQIMNLFGKD
jgi:regulator of protease activity HflC (stomatin/prohibitin superfamily)